MPRILVHIIGMLVLAVLAGQSTPESRALEPPANDDARVWTDRSGKHSTNARLIELRKDAVVLETDQGKTVTVPINRLGRDDLLYLKQFRAARAEREAREKGVTYGDPNTVHIRLGLEATAQGGPCKNLLCTFPIPMDWPEQTVTIVEQDISPQIRGTNTRLLKGTAKQFEFRIPRLPAGATARAVLTFKIERRHIQPPPNPDLFVFGRELDIKLRAYLKESPWIEVRHPTVIAAAKNIELDDSQTAWQQVETIYDWTRDKVDSDGTKPLKGALAALVSGTGDCEEISSLFVAMCRLKKIPARCVWIDRHTYPEFYLEDDNGAGHWIPCESLGDRNFGGVEHVAPILQKGDNFRMSQKEGPQRYVAPTCSCMLSAGSGQPVIREIREKVDAGE